MNSKIVLLAGLGVAQLVLIAALFFASGPQQRNEAPLLDLDLAAVTSLVISDGDDEVQVDKRADGWLVAGVPADTDKVTRILDKLANASATWPVSTSSSSAERFEVSAQSYQRRIRVAGESGQLAELFLGTSPSYQRVHARETSSDDVYSIALSNYELGVKIDDWLDKGLLATKDVPTQIELKLLGLDEPGQQTLSRGEEGWLFNGVAADTGVAQTYANRFTTLRVLGLAEAAVQTSEVARLSIGYDDNKTIFVISTELDSEDGDYFISRQNESDQTVINYRLASYTAEQLLMTDVDFAIEESAEELSSQENDDG